MPTTLKGLLESAIASLIEEKEEDIDYTVIDWEEELPSHDKTVKGDYTPVVKMRRSQLMEFSCQSGRHSDFVIHAHLDRPIGKKKAGSLLCGASRPKYDFSAEYSSEVSCPKCQQKLGILGLTPSTLLKLYGKDSTNLEDVPFWHYS